jgi:hypothetical protein
MKKQDRIKNEAQYIKDRLKLIIRHIKNVQDNCILLGEKLIDLGEFDLGKLLIANGFKHDVSKFIATEWDNMDHYQGDKDTTKLRLAVSQHNRSNMHHPEYWGSIHLMPRVFIAEMCCDWKSRSEEFGSSLTEWINEKATARFCFKKDDAVYKSIMEFVDLLCDKPFEQNPSDMAS